MFVLIIIAFLIGFGLYYATTIDFEVGDGFTEMKKNVREVDYEIVEKEENKKLKA